MDPIDIEILSSDSNYATDISDDSSATGSIENPKYKCKYCPKKFEKTQALGGHQNAHRKEREVTKQQKEALLAHLNQPDPDMYSYSYSHSYPHPFPNQYALPPGFEEPRYKVDTSENLTMSYNQYAGSSSTGFARSDPSQGTSWDWTFTGIPFQPQTQTQPLLSASSPVCLDLCLGVGNSQTQPKPEEPNDATEEMVVENDDSSLSLSLKL